MKKSIKRLLCGAGLASAIMVLVSAMTVLAVNPYLPFDEYMPDCEPRVFGDRVYIYGSHDIADYYGGGCAGSYEAYICVLLMILITRLIEGVLYDKTEGSRISAWNEFACVRLRRKRWQVLFILLAGYEYGWRES